MSKLKKGFSQIEFCKFKDEIGYPIENNQEYINIKKVFRALLSCTETLSDISFNEDETTQNYYAELIKTAKELL